MRLRIKAKEVRQLSDGRWELTTDVEELKEALREHSPNILIDYLNAVIRPPIGRIKLRGRSSAKASEGFSSAKASENEKGGKR